MHNILTKTDCSHGVFNSTSNIISIDRANCNVLNQVNNQLNFQGPLHLAHRFIHRNCG